MGALMTSSVQTVKSAPVRSYEGVGRMVLELQLREAMLDREAEAVMAENHVLKTRRIRDL